MVYRDPKDPKESEAIVDQPGPKDLKENEDTLAPKDLRENAPAQNDHRADDATNLHRHAQFFQTVDSKSMSSPMFRA
jgi:hypothetical protein